MTRKSEDYPEDSELGNPTVIHNHYEQKKNGNGVTGSTLNTVLLGCLLAIVGFLGIQLWNMNDRLARVETNMQTLLRQQADP